MTNGLCAFEGSRQEQPGSEGVAQPYGRGRAGHEGGGDAIPPPAFLQRPAFRDVLGIDRVTYRSYVAAGRAHGRPGRGQQVPGHEPAYSCRGITTVHGQRPPVGVHDNTGALEAVGQLQGLGHYIN